MLRWMCGVTKIDKTRNEHVSERDGGEDRKNKWNYSWKRFRESVGLRMERERIGQNKLDEIYSKRFRRHQMMGKAREEKK